MRDCYLIRNLLGSKEWHGGGIEGCSGGTGGANGDPKKCREGMQGWKGMEWYRGMFKGTEGCTGDMERCRGANGVERVWMGM